MGLLGEVWVGLREHKGAEAPRGEQQGESLLPGLERRLMRARAIGGGGLGMWRKDIAPVRDYWASLEGGDKKDPKLSLSLCSLVSASTSHWTNPTIQQSHQEMESGEFSPFCSAPPRAQSWAWVFGDT